jgi:hypothetical protein
VQDIYSLGATLYELITSKPPYFRGDIRFQILDLDRVPPSMAERRAELERNGKPIPQLWEDVLAACLAKDPALRPKTALEVLERLRPVPPPVVVEPPVQVAGKTSLVMMLAGFLAILGLLAVVIFQWAERQDRMRGDLTQKLAALESELRGKQTGPPPSLPETALVPETPPGAVTTPDPGPATPGSPAVTPSPEKPLAEEKAPAGPPVAEQPPPKDPAAIIEPPMPSTPPVIPVPVPASAADETAIRSFIIAHLKREQSENGRRDLDAIMRDYDTSVRTDDRPAANHAQIRKDKLDYFTQWPYGGETIDGTIKVEMVNESEWDATFHTRIDRWVGKPKKKSRRGNVELTYRVRRVGEEFKIAAERVINRSFQ